MFSPTGCTILNKCDKLKSLSDLNITSINLNNLTTVNKISNGNLITSEGSFTKNLFTTITNDDATTTTITNEDGSTTTITNDDATTTTIASETVRNYANLDLAINQTNSISYTYNDNGNVINDYTLNLDTLSLPFIRGYGNVEALPIAASRNSDLLNSLKELSDIGMADLTKMENCVN